MKKLLTLFLIVVLLVFVLLPVVLISQENEPNVIETVSGIKVTTISLFNSGPRWIIESWDNLLMFLLSIVGLGRLIVLITPTKKDDIWLKRYVLTPLRFIGKLFSLDLKSNSE